MALLNFNCPGQSFWVSFWKGNFTHEKLCAKIYLRRNNSPRWCSSAIELRDKVSVWTVSSFFQTIHTPQRLRNMWMLPYEGKNKLIVLSCEYFFWVFLFCNIQGKFATMSFLYMPDVLSTNFLSGRFYNSELKFEILWVSKFDTNFSTFPYIF